MVIGNGWLQLDVMLNPFSESLIDGYNKKSLIQIVFASKWIPELQGAPVNLIHEWYDTVNSTIDKSTQFSQIENYSRPIVEHQKKL